MRCLLNVLAVLTFWLWAPVVIVMFMLLIVFVVIPLDCMHSFFDTADERNRD